MERRMLGMRIGALSLVMAALFALGQAADVAAATTHVVFHGSRANKVIALTFDDGWGISECKSIVHTLQSMKVKATFFPNAAYVRWAPDFWRHVAALGYPIGNHTLNHPDLTTLSRKHVHHQIGADERIIESITGKPMIKVFRPPYGAYNGTVLSVAAQLGYRTTLLWDTTDGDTGGGSDAAHLRDAMRGTNGSVLLMHCGPSVTPRILPDIIRGYRKRGFTFVTVPQLLAKR
jgi:peptidoglycan/xylan/chitin deacetylase (PgdA/CDA1 family)